MSFYTIIGKGHKVKMLNIIGNPIGVITKTYDVGYLEKAGWVRLDNGVLLKDVLDSEVEFLDNE